MPNPNKTYTTNETMDITTRYKPPLKQPEINQTVAIYTPSVSSQERTKFISYYVNEKYTVGYESETHSQYKEIKHGDKNIKIRLVAVTQSDIENNQNDKYYSNGILVLFDVTNPESFTSSQILLKKLKEKYPDNPIILVGSSSDLTNGKKVFYDDVENVALAAGVPYIEVSAKEGTNVNEVFDEIFKKSLQTGNSPSPNNDQIKKTLTKKLDAYIKRVEQNKNANGTTNFSAGFWFFAESRALNRQANYLLAKDIRSSLEKADIDIFNKTLSRRGELIKENNIDKYDVYVERDINSSELNDIITEGKSFAST